MYLHFINNWKNIYGFTSNFIMYLCCLLYVFKLKYLTLKYIYIKFNRFNIF
jgi:hypothetical protein